MIVKFVVILSIVCFVSIEAQLSYLQSWWNSDSSSSSSSSSTHTFTFGNDFDDKKVSVVKYGEWTSAPARSTQSPHFTTIRYRPQSTVRTTTVQPTTTTTRRPTTRKSTPSTTTTRPITTTRSSTASTQLFGFYDDNLLDHTVIYITTPRSPARSINIKQPTTSPTVVIGDWTAAPSTESTTASTGPVVSLFDLMLTPSSPSILTVSSSITTPKPSSTATATTATSLFDSTEIFFENFTKKDPTPHHVSVKTMPLKEAIAKIFDPIPMASKMPPIPSGFKEVLRNHTLPSSSLFDNVSDTKTTRPPTLSTTTTLTTISVSSTEASLFSDEMNSSNSNMFKISRPSGNIDKSLIIHKDGIKYEDNDEKDIEEKEELEGQEKDLDNEKHNDMEDVESKMEDTDKGRFGITRPMIRGFVLDEVERSSSADKLPLTTLKYFNNNKYKTLKHKNKREMTIEQILDASRAKKGINLGKTMKPNYPVYVKNIVNANEEFRNHLQKKQEKSLFPAFPFPTGKVFDSGTGKLKNFDLVRSRSLTLNNDEAEEDHKTEVETVDKEQKGDDEDDVQEDKIDKNKDIEENENDENDKEGSRSLTLQDDNKKDQNYEDNERNGNEEDKKDEVDDDKDEDDNEGSIMFTMHDLKDIGDDNYGGLDNENDVNNDDDNYDEDIQNEKHLSKYELTTMTSFETSTTITKYTITSGMEEELGSGDISSIQDMEEEGSGKEQEHAEIENKDDVLFLYDENDFVLPVVTERAMNENSNGDKLEKGRSSLHFEENHKIASGSPNLVSTTNVNFYKRPFYPLFPQPQMRYFQPMPPVQVVLYPELIPPYPYQTIPGSQLPTERQLLRAVPSSHPHPKFVHFDTRFYHPSILPHTHITY